MQPATGKGAQTSVKAEGATVPPSQNSNPLRMFGRAITSVFGKKPSPHGGYVGQIHTFEPSKLFTKRDIVWNQVEKHASFNEAARSMLGIQSTAAPLLGEGQFGTVSVWEDATNRHRNFAVKVLNDKADSETYKGLERGEGMALLACGKHPNIVQTYALLLRDKGKDNYVAVYQHAIWESCFPAMEVTALISECVEGENLKSLLKPSRHACLGSITCSTVIAEQVASAIGFLHKYEFVFRDLKPANIIVNKGNLNTKLVDFGLCKPLPNRGRTQSLCGTPNYQAPEMITSFCYGQRDTYSMCPEYGVAVDVWSFGVLLMELATELRPAQFKPGVYPFPENGNVLQEREVVYKRTLAFASASEADKYGFCLTGHIYPPSQEKHDALMLTIGLLNNDPEKRTSLENACTALHHINKSAPKRKKQK